MKKIILVAATALFTLSAFAQEKALKNYGFGDNWFFQIQGGGSYTFSEGHTKLDFLDRVSPHAAVSVGKFFSPVVAGRLQVSGWESKNHLKGSKDDSYKFNYGQVNFDAMWNLANLFTAYTGDKAFNFYAITGLGYQHVFGKAKYGVETQNSLVPRAGLQFDFRLSDAVSFNVEGMGQLLPDNFNGNVTGRKYDATVDVMLGITYRFNKGGFELVDAADPKLIASLNDQINQQRSLLSDKDRELERLRAELAKKPAPAPAQVIKEVKEETETVLNAVVVFKLGSAQLQDNQEINIYNAARYLQDNPGVNVTVTGYADKATGTAAINQKLSEQRAKAVADILTKKYGISPSRITTEASGDREQPFQIDAWNRVVIFRAK